MSKILQNVEVSLDEDLKEKLQWLEPTMSDFRILKKSVDARKRHAPHYVYSVEIAETGETLKIPEINLEKLKAPHPNFQKPIIIGAGPGGLFAALRLIERGIPCLLFERGSSAESRIKGINRFWRYGELDRRNNVCFGEGGAGLYSDGKLITRIKSDHIAYVMDRLVQFGAPSEIRYLSNPHVGSDKIRRVIPIMRKFLLENGCEIHFDSEVQSFITSENRVTGIITEHGRSYSSDQIIVATGHSADEILFSLEKSGVHLDGKSFALGLRIEHPQPLINKIQYGDHPNLGSANYKLTHHDHQSGIGVYSFCMCPGGYVLSSGTEPDGVVCNGMSNYNRNSPYANAAIVVSIDHEKNFGSNKFGGLELRRKLEMKAYEAVLKAGGTKELPAQKLKDFLKGTLSPIGKTSSPSGAIAVRLDLLLPELVTQKLKEGLIAFNDKMKGFLSDDAILFGVETRTSSPVRVTRDAQSLQSISHAGLYPCGEGAGYAGGITSAACDGVKIADIIYNQMKEGIHVKNYAQR